MDEDTNKDVGLSFDETTEIILEDSTDAGITEARAEESVTLEEETKSAVPVAVREENALRGENMKVFEMSDDSKQAVFYAEPKHVYDENEGCFVEIDNSLVEDEDGRHYRNGKSYFTARFSKEEDSDEIFVVEKGTYQLTLSMLKSTKRMNKCVTPRLLEKNADNAEDQEGATKLAYEDIAENADFEYEVSGDGVKENIVIKKDNASYRYSFGIDCANLEMQFFADERRLTFQSAETGAEIFNIPAPFMTDAAGVHSDGVFYEVKTLTDGRIALSIIADSEWINAEGRAFPVTIDPQVKVSGSSSMNTYSWYNGSMSSASTHTIGTTGSGGTCNYKRMYMNLIMPTLPRNPRIKKAELTMSQFSGSCQCGGYPKIGLYKVTQPIYTGTCTPAYDENLLDYEVIKGGSGATYIFDITSMIDSINKGETTYPNLMFKMIDETCQCIDSVVWYGSTSANYQPKLMITYESSYGVNTSSRTNTHQLGRLGTAGIDLQNGNLMLESEDFAWGGRKMPVTIKHYYNSALSNYSYTANSSIGLNTADFSSMKVGNGWKLNYMQSMMAKTFTHEEVTYSGYVYIGETGDEVYFKVGTTDALKKCCYPEGGQCCEYYLYEDVNGGSYTYDPCKNELYMGDETYLFESGRLVKITNKYNSTITLTYTSGKLTSITDGAERVFALNYSIGGLLNSITSPNAASITYLYSNDRLTAITYPDNRKATLTYSPTDPYVPTEVLLTDAAGTINLYKTTYAYSNGRISAVTECGYNNNTEVQGQSSTYTYSIAARKTTVTTVEPADYPEVANTITTVYTFDDDGNIADSYVYTVDTGNVGVNEGGSGINPYAGDGGASVVSNINNLLLEHNFDTLTNWTSAPANCCDFYVDSYTYQNFALYGSRILRMRSLRTAAAENGVYQTSNTLPAGKYTFSVYVKILITAATGDATITNPGAYIQVKKTDGTVLGKSEHIAKYTGEYVRLVVPFELTEAEGAMVQTGIYIDGMAYMDADGAQLENNAYANAYNMLINGNFERDLTGWCGYDSGITTVTDTKFNMSRSLRMLGSVTAAKNTCQTVSVKTYTDVRETFTLSGWAKGYGIPERTRVNASDALFQLRAKIIYSDSTVEDHHIAAFSPCTEDWQFASIQFSKEKYKTVQCITVHCEYSYNVGYAYFDDIQLVRDSYESGLSSGDFTTASETSGDEDFSESTEESTATFEEAMDAFGNALTETTFKDGEFGSIYRAFKYNCDDLCTPPENAGNDLLEETDARGNKTVYTVNEDTSRTTTVTDRCDTKTEYDYDAGGRTTAIRVKDSADTQLADAAYAYDTFDQLSGISRGDGMGYAFAYNDFHNLESIGIVGLSTPLVQYAYKNGNGRLKQVTYANGDKMYATYNSIGQIMAETWKDASDAVVAWYKYIYDGSGNIVRSIDILLEKEYNYYYENGKISRSTESDITLTNEIITAKVIVNTVLYTYASDGQLTKKRIQTANGSENVYTYEHSEDGNTVAKLPTGVTSHSKTDHLGRKEFDELQLGKGFLSRQFSYTTGEVTGAHEANSKLKSSPTTSLVSMISFADGSTISYGYDNEERITSILEKENGTTTKTIGYTYDAQGQLLSETVDNVTTTFTYDSYGNILTKGTNTYTYGDTDWKDKLTAYNGIDITYDAGGNPTSYRGYTFAWEKGRQLKSAKENSNIFTYTYNASGIRTGKTVNGVEHKYVLEGTKILRETYGTTALDYLYDNEDGICGLKYNGTPYYFYKNLQGDIIAITNSSGDVVAKYSYDAWGDCTINFDDSSVSIAFVNPFRYRGYYQDTETGLFYVGSRYYDPEIGRFINADNPQILMLAAQSDYILGTNLFAYCMNNPVNHADPTGEWLARLITGVAGAAAFGALAFIVCKMFGLDGKTTAIITAAFAVLGGIIGAVLGPSFLLKHAPKLLKAINAIEKTKFSLKAIPPNTHGNIFGINISNILMIMLHYPHPNELFFHIQVDVKLPGIRQKTIWKKPIYYVKSMKWW